MNILLVEDEAVPALDLKMRLEGFGHRVLDHASSGARAVELALSLKPDLVLMDIKLKGDMDGIEAAGKIREHRNTPVVFLTAFSDRTTLKRSMSIAPHGYVLKPVNDRDLFATLEAAFVRSALEQDLQRRLRVEKLYSEIAARAAVAESPEEFLPGSLRIIGETMKVDRAYFLEHDPDRKIVNNAYEWCAPGVASADDVMNGQPAREGVFFFDVLKREDRFLCSDTAKVEDPEARKTLEAQDIRSLLIFTVESEGQLFGYIGFDDCRNKREWSPEDLRTLEIMVDLLKGLFRRLRSEARLCRQIDLERTLVKSSGILINAASGDVDQALDSVLGIVGRSLEADRAYIFRFDNAGRFYSNTHEWCAEGVESQIDSLQGRDTRLMDFFHSKLLSNEVFLFEDTEELPDNAGPERESFRRQSIKSLIIVPAFIRGVLRGFTGFDSVRFKRSWSGVDKEILKVFSEMCLGTLERGDIKEEL